MPCLIAFRTTPSPSDGTYSNTRIPRLRSGNSNRLNPSIERTAENEYRRHTTEAITIEGTRVPPVDEAQRSLLPNYPPSGIDDSEEEESRQADKFQQRKPELRLPERRHAEELEGEEGSPEDELSHRVSIDAS